MKIRYTQTIATAALGNGIQSRNVGQVEDVPSKFATQMVEAGLAEQVDEEKAPRKRSGKRVSGAPENKDN